MKKNRATRTDELIGDLGVFSNNKNTPKATMEGKDTPKATMEDKDTAFVQAVAQRLEDKDTAFVQAAAQMLEDKDTAFVQAAAQMLEDKDTAFVQAAAQMLDEDTFFVQAAAQMLDEDGKYDGSFVCGGNDFFQHFAVVRGLWFLHSCMFCQYDVAAPIRGARAAQSCFVSLIAGSLGVCICGFCIRGLCFLSSCMSCLLSFLHRLFFNVHLSSVPEDEC